MIGSDPLGFAGAVVAMTLACYLMRTGGYWLIGRFTLGPRVHRMLDALPGAIIASTVAPILVKGGAGAALAVGAAALTMALVRNDFAAVLAGVGTAALVRAFGM
jgi:uncharacterized membrane protein